MLSRRKKKNIAYLGDIMKIITMLSFVIQTSAVSFVFVLAWIIMKHVRCVLYSWIARWIHGTVYSIDHILFTIVWFVCV